MFLSSKVKKGAYNLPKTTTGINSKNEIAENHPGTYVKLPLYGELKRLSSYSLKL